MTESQFEYPDGSTPPLDENGEPILEDRSAEFPDEAAEAEELVGDPVFSRELGPDSGLSAPYGLMAKRAARRLGLDVPEPEEPDAEEPGGGAESPEGTDTPEGDESTPDGTETEPAEGDEPVADGESTGDEPEVPESDEAEPEGDEPEGEPEEPESEPEPEAVTDLGYNPTDGTVADVQAYLAEHPDQSTYVIERERAGKARVSLIGA